MVTDPTDILGKSLVPDVHEKAAPPLAGLEKKIYLALALEPLTVDEIAITLGENVVEITKSLSLMSLKGLIGESGGKFFLLSS